MVVLNSDDFYLLFSPFQGKFCNVWRHFTFSVSWRVILASGWKPERLLENLQCTEYSSYNIKLAGTCQ